MLHSTQVTSAYLSSQVQCWPLLRPSPLSTSTIVTNVAVAVVVAVAAAAATAPLPSVVTIAVTRCRPPHLHCHQPSLQLPSLLLFTLAAHCCRHSPPPLPPPSPVNVDHCRDCLCCRHWPLLQPSSLSMLAIVLSISIIDIDHHCGCLHC